MLIPTFPVTIYRSASFRAVSEGEPWGGIGERAEMDYPEARAVWEDGTDVRIVDESEFKRLYGHRF